MRKISLCMMIMMILIGCGKTESTATLIPFPEITGVNMEGDTITNEVFDDYDATIVNFWNNGCGTCIEEMPELEEYFLYYKELNVNLIGIGTDSGESDEKYEFAQNVLKEKGVTYTNIAPDTTGDLYNEFIPSITGYPTTYIVDGSGNIVGTPIVGNVKKQDDVLKRRIEYIKEVQ